MYKKFRWGERKRPTSRFNWPKKKRWPRRLAVAALVAAGIAILGALALRSALGPDRQGRAFGSEDPAARAAGLPAPPPEPAGLSIAAVGDVLFSRNIAPVVESEGSDSTFAAAGPLLAGADLRFCNLETPASFVGKPFEGKNPDVTFRASPGALFSLKAARFDVVSVANNHINDFGPEALVETVKALDYLGLAHCGAGANAEAAAAPAKATAKGKRVSFIGFAEAMWSVVPAGEAPGVSVIDKDRVVEAVKKAKADADYVVVSVHWGEEHQPKPRDSDRDLARAFIDAGAALVIGHHPHVLQGAEFYRGGLVVYSMGNFMFDMISPRTYDSAVATIRFDDAGPAEIRWAPVTIDRSSYRPAPAAGDDVPRIAKLIKDRCALLGGTAELAADGTVALRR